MTRRLPPALDDLGVALGRTAGGYLHNALREPPETCSVCATPVDGWQRCFKCNEHAKSGLPIADFVASMVYAVKRSPAGERDQMYTAMYGYKAPYPQATYVNVVRTLLLLGIVGHLDCVLSLSGASDVRWATVPGTQHAREHPLHRLVASMFTSPDLEVPLRLSPTATKERALRPGGLIVEAAMPRDTHIALIDDSWVTGGSAQSAAVALRQAGAASVSILTVARVLEPTYRTTEAFLRSDSWGRPFDYAICPWTGGDCP